MPLVSGMDTQNSDNADQNTEVPQHKGKLWSITINYSMNNQMKPENL